MKNASLHDWLQTPLGAYLLAREQAHLDQITPDVFGYHAVQLGLPGIDLLRESRIANRLKVAPDRCADVPANFNSLPFATQSVDLVVLPHLLEFAADPHDILREVDRIMIPEGRVIIIGFNPWSLFGGRRALGSSTGYPWNGRFISLLRMKDWLSLLGFDVSTGHLACYIPPVRGQKWIQRYSFLEVIGERWLGVTGAVYMLEAIKRVSGMHIITPAWNERQARDKKYGAVAKRPEAARTASHLHIIK